VEYFVVFVILSSCSICDSVMFSLNSRNRRTVFTYFTRRLVFIFNHYIVTSTKFPLRNSTAKIGIIRNDVIRSSYLRPETLQINEVLL
jgi:hypothetical protein